MIFEGEHAKCTHHCTWYVGVGCHQYPSLYPVHSAHQCTGLDIQYSSFYPVPSIHHCTWHQVSIIACTWYPVPIILPGTQYPSLYVPSAKCRSLYLVPSGDHCTCYRVMQICARVGQGSPSPYCHRCKKSSGWLAENLMSHNIHRKFDTKIFRNRYRYHQNNWKSFETEMSHNIHRNDNDNEKYSHKDQCHQCKKASGSFAEKIYI